MRIGVVPILDGSTGGIYQYSLTILDGLLEYYKKNKSDEIIILTEDLHNNNLPKYKENGLKVYPLYKKSFLKLLVKKWINDTFLEKILTWYFHSLSSKSSNLPKSKIGSDTKLYEEQRQWFLENKIDLMIYSTPNPMSFHINIPYIFTIHDLQHRLQPNFPEVSLNNEWKEREDTFSNGIKSALLIVVDSQTGKEDVLNLYKNTGISDNRIKILPFVPPSYVDKTTNNSIDIQHLLKIPSKYLFYPAQFWPHKNHKRIIIALGIIKKKYNLDIPLVLSGSHEGKIRTETYNEVVKEAQKLKINSNIYYLGYIEDKYIVALYKSAKALIMPTFFGPTNMPILEAWKLNCPVLTSDIRGVKEQAGNAAYLVNPNSVKSIANGIYNIWTDDKLRVKLISNGRKRIALYTKDDYNKRLISILDEAKMTIKKLNK